MLFKKGRSSLCHTGLSKTELQALAVTGSFLFKNLLKVLPQVRLAHWAAEYIIPLGDSSLGSLLVFAHEKMYYKVPFLHHFCEHSALFLARNCCWQAATGHISSMLHPLWPCVAQMSHVCPACLVLHASIWSHVHKSASQHMGYRAHTQIPNRNLACLTGKRAKNSFISICLCESWGRCMDSLSPSHLLLISVDSYKARRTSQWTYLQFKVGM